MKQATLDERWSIGLMSFALILSAANPMTFWADASLANGFYALTLATSTSAFFTFAEVRLRMAWPVAAASPVCYIIFASPLMSEGGPHGSPAQSCMITLVLVISSLVALCGLAQRETCEVRARKRSLLYAGDTVAQRTKKPPADVRSDGNAITDGEIAEPQVEHSLLDTQCSQGDCLAPGTRVILEGGDTLLACNVIAGQRLLTMDCTTGALTSAAVTAVSKQLSPSWHRHLTVTSESGARFTCTPNHPVARFDRQDSMRVVSVPTAAANLVPGDCVSAVSFREERIVRVDVLTSNSFGDVTSFELDSDGLAIFVAGDPENNQAGLAVYPGGDVSLPGRAAPCAASLTNMQGRASDATSSAVTSTHISSYKSSEGHVSSAGNEVVTIGKRGTPRVLSLAVMESCPKDPDGHYVSLGARQHEKGTCAACKFAKSAQGCRDGALCLQCHHPHDEKTRSARKRHMRRQGLERRAIFEKDAMQLVPHSVRNTFVHVGDDGDAVEVEIQRSHSDPDLVHRVCL